MAEREAMSDTNYELEIFKLVESDLVTERGWVSETEFYVWVSYLDIQDFMNGLRKICGYEMFDEGGFDANMQSDGVCIDLTDALSSYGLDFESIFDKEKYQH